MAYDKQPGPNWGQEKQPVAGVIHPDDASHFVLPDDTIITSRKLEIMEAQQECPVGFVWCGDRNSCIEYTELC